MALFGSLLTLAGTLIGAKKDSDARKRSDWMNSPQGIRANAEEAGFNPLAFVGPGTGTGAQYAPTMGSTIANGFALASDQFQEQLALKRQKTELEQENRRLEKVVQATTLTPKVPGVYGSAASSGDNRRNTSRPIDGRGDDSNRRLNKVDPTRDLDVAPVSDGPGLTQISNKYVPRGFVVPGSDGEPWGIDEVVTALTFGAPQVIKQGVEAYLYNREMAPHERAWKEWDKRQRASKNLTEKQKRGDRRKRRAN